jgi:hypothetical protein
MSRYKDFDATGIAPGGRLYAGDLNGIQDSTRCHSFWWRTFWTANLEHDQELI